MEIKINIDGTNIDEISWKCGLLQFIIHWSATNHLGQGLNLLPHLGIVQINMYILRLGLPLASGIKIQKLTVTGNHPLLKETYTRPETTSVGNIDFSPRLAETKRNQQFLEKSGL